MRCNRPGGKRVSKPRPVGVTILAILAFLLGLLFLLGAISSFLAAGLPFDELQDLINNVPEFIVENASLIFTTFGVMLLIFAVVSFLVTYGFLNGRQWAWTVGILLGILSIISNVVNVLIYMDVSNLSSAIIGIAIAVVIIFYLTRPGVKRYFFSSPI